MSPFTLHAGDNREVLKTLEANSVDAIVCDPPYHLTSGKKGGTGEAGVNLESPYGRARVTTGFMGMTWDGGDVANRPETWAECLRVAKPGAWLLAFGGTRTFHRMACAIEDAGWELRDAPVRGHVHQPEDCPWLMGWMYGSGFPKSHNGEWGGTALKPAWEPIVCARKPLIGTVAENFAAHGTGGLNIDGCRVGVEGGTAKGSKPQGAGNGIYGAGLHGACEITQLDAGRWPANLMHDGSDEAASPLGDASRFFYCAKASREDRNEGCQHMAKKPLLWSSGTQNSGSFQADGTDRSSQNFHPTVKPTELMRWLVRLVAPANGLVLDPFMGSGSTGKACVLEGRKFIGVDLNPEYIAIALARIEFAMRQGHQPSFLEAA